MRESIKELIEEEFDIAEEEEEEEEIQKLREEKDGRNSQIKRWKDGSRNWWGNSSSPQAYTRAGKMSDFRRARKFTKQAEGNIRYSP